VDTYWIGDRCYRRNPITAWPSRPIRRHGHGREDRTGDTADAFGQEEEDEEEDEPADCSLIGSRVIEKSIEDEEDQADEVDHQPEQVITEPVKMAVDIVFDSMARRWSTKIMVAQAFMGKLIGAKGVTRQQIERETKCHLLLPKRGDNTSPIVISSTISAECLSRCSDRIRLIVFLARCKLPSTHFVSIPMAILAESYARFKSLVMNSTKVSATCKNEALFVSPKKLHMTIVMLSLQNDQERAMALDALRKIVDDRIRPLIAAENGLKVKVSGLEIMNDDQLEVDVLYAKCQSTSMQRVADLIAQGMQSSELTVNNKERSVKLHMTLMNTKYAQQAETSCLKMNVVELLKAFGNYDFGAVTVTEVQLSVRFSTVDPITGYYPSSGSVSLL